MIRRRLKMPALPNIASLALGLTLAAAPAAAQPASTSFCFVDGSQIKAERFESRGGNFQLYVPGSATPLQYPASSVCSVNVDPCICGGRAPAGAAAPAQRADGVDRFGVYGSNTIGERMMPMLIEAFAKRTYGADPVVKITNAEEKEITLVQGGATKAIIDFQAHGSATGPSALLSGKAQIAMTSRPISADEAAALDQKYQVDMFAPENEHILSLGAGAVIVNAANPVAKLTLEQSARLFSGAIANWREVGGPDLPVTIYRRDDKSGTFDLMKAKVLDPSGQQIARSAKSFESSELLSSNVARDPGGIGFVEALYAGDNVTVRIASACGIVSAPTAFSTKTEEYPISRRLFAYTLGRPQSPVASDLLRFSLSDEASALKVEAGYVGSEIEFQDAAEQDARTQVIVNTPHAFLGANDDVPADATKFFASAMSGMRRASVELRFRSNDANLDTLALRDVKRLGQFLSSAEIAEKPFLVVGFADTDGGWAKNLKLAKRRAQIVANALKKASGLGVSDANVRSLSYMAPVACNDTEAGKAKNRRVEVWIGR